MTETIFRTILLAFCLALAMLPAPALAREAVVVAVPSGDSLVVRNETGRPVRVRLYGIYAPLPGQELHAEARQLLAQAAIGRTVRLEVASSDRYGRLIGTAFLPDEYESLNEKLVRAGLAWVRRRDCTDPRCDAWLALEIEARKEQVGLWSLPAPRPPWEMLGGTGDPAS